MSPWSAIAVLGFVAACSSGGTTGTVQVFAASSLTDAFGEVADAFETSGNGVEVELVLGGSSSLREQILDGAEADVFASANAAVMADLVAAGATRGPADPFAANTLALVVPAGNPAGLTSIDELTDAEFVLGVCAPEVPCGAAADELFELAGFEPQPDTREPNVRALLAKIEAGELDAGVVYHSDISGSTVEAVPLPVGLQVEVDYSIAAVAVAGRAEADVDNEAAANTDAFIDFVHSPEGQAILVRHGFINASDR